MSTLSANDIAQKQAYEVWTKDQLMQRNITPNDMEELSDGVKLNHLIEILTNENIPKKWHKDLPNEKNFRYSFLFRENCTIGLNFLNQKNININQIDHLLP
jgi:hypothetical protein